jgi:acyl carrier protein
MKRMDEKTRAHIKAREDVLGKLRLALIEKMHVRKEPDELDPDVALFGSGFGLDSLDAVELVVFLESEFGLKSADNDPMIMRGSMRTLNTLVDLVLAFGKGFPDAAGTAATAKGASHGA